MLKLWSLRKSWELLPFEKTLFGAMLPDAAQAYGDVTFIPMTMAKVYWTTHLVNALGYNLLFQDVDVVWYRDTVPYLEESFEGWDVVFQDYGARTQQFAPFSPNTGKLVYVRKIEITMRFHISPSCLSQASE